MCLCVCLCVCLSLCVSVCVSVYLWHSVLIKVRGQLLGVTFLLPPCFRGRIFLVSITLWPKETLSGSPISISHLALRLLGLQIGSPTSSFLCGFQRLDLVVRLVWQEPLPTKSSHWSQWYSFLCWVENTFHCSFSSEFTLTYMLVFNVWNVSSFKGFS